MHPVWELSQGGILWQNISSWALTPQVSAQHPVCTKLYLLHAPFIHWTQGIKESQLDSLMKNFIEAKSLMRQLPRLLQKLVDTLWLYSKEKTSQRPLVEVLRGVCSHCFFKMSWWSCGRTTEHQVCLWVCIILSWSWKQMKEKAMG